MSLEIETFAQLVFKADEEKNKDKAYQAWLVQLPMMIAIKDIEPFEEYWKRQKENNIDVRPTAMIVAELDEIERMFE